MIPIPNYEDLYAITEDGRVWSCSKQRWMTIEESGGRHWVQLWKDGSGRRTCVEKILQQIHEIEYKVNIKKPRVTRT